MKLIVRQRASGKTSSLICASAMTDIPIVVHNKNLIPYIVEEAQKHGFDIPKPIFVEDLHNDKVKANDVLIDEGYKLIEDAVKAYLGGANPIAITFTPPEWDK